EKKNWIVSACSSPVILVWEARINASISIFGSWLLYNEAGGCTEQILKTRSSVCCAVESSFHMPFFFILIRCISL
ncbi:unnamed protein product, partial [Brassica rapa]